MEFHAKAALPPRIRWFRLPLPEWAERILDAGIVSDDPHVRRRQRFTNVAAYALALDATTHLIVNSFYDLWALMPVNVYNVVVTVVYLSLHRLHRLGGNFAANALIAVSLVGHSYVVFAFGRDSNLHIYFTLAGFSLFLVGVRHWRNFLVLYALSVAALVTVMTFASNEGFVMSWDTAFRDSLATQAMLSAIVLNACVVTYTLFTLDRAETNLQLEYERSERLLTTILPAPIAARLKAGNERRIADRLDDVTVLFADLVGFTPAAANAAPTQVVDYLHRLFARCDVLCEAYGVEKIKTIGDAYMAVGGLHDDGTGADAVGRLALAILEAVKHEKLAGEALSVRIGINRGPVIAGVIGDRRMSYDVWGDTVNTASRLASSSQPGRIHVSASFERRGKPAFSFEPRGSVEIKGIGRRETYFLKSAD